MASRRPSPAESISRRPEGWRERCGASLFTTRLLAAPAISGGADAFPAACASSAARAGVGGVAERQLRSPLWLKIGGVVIPNRRVRLMLSSHYLGKDLF
ncbi:hypothetical protein [Stutzerimonas stutzeri]|uniref:hypothetical protein n=1 Tax=Stutzerimonas stutzeri TaxID=316 RepID=UPI002109FBAC|nr:hypothetical protein [Stutzerimonas stutzeri]MCQ4322477.1 hypothetical protein [Stutzerimonas stutzeri]